MAIQKRQRSPSVPFIGLDTSLHRARVVYNCVGLGPLTPTLMVKMWGLAPRSSGATRTIAALRAYGLIENSSLLHRIRVSDFGARVLTTQDAEALQRAYAAAALKPKLIADYALIWRGARPTDSECIAELETLHRFTAPAASAFLEVFDEAMWFIGGGATGVFPAIAKDPAELPPFCAGIKIGDYVHPPSDSADDPPRRVVWLADAGRYVYVEKSLTRYPIAAVMRIDTSPGPSAPPPQNADSVAVKPESASKPVPSRKSGRRASFPRIQLSWAIEQTRQLIKAAGRGWVSIIDAANLWNARGRYVLWTAAALCDFGLAEQKGHGKARKVRVTELGWRAVEQPDMETVNALREAVSKVSLFTHYAREWQGGRPPEAACFEQLAREQGFPVRKAVLFLSVFDDCMIFISPERRYSPVDSKGTSPSPPVIVENQPLLPSDIAPSPSFAASTEDRPLLLADASPPASALALIENRPVPAVDISPLRKTVLNIAQHGNRVAISADLDLAGLRQLQEMLPHYRAILELLVPMPS